MTSFLNNRQQWEVIQDGDAADVIITDDPSVIRRLKRQGLMDVFTSNRWLDEALFVITPASWDDTPEPLPNFEQDITLPWRDDSSQPSFVPRMTSAQLRDTTSSETRVFLELHKHLRSWLSQGPIYILSPEGSYTDSLTQLSLDLLRLPNSTSTQLAWFEHPEPLVRRFHDAPGTIIAPESSLRTIRAMLPNNSAVRGELPLPSNQPLTLFVAVVAGEHMSIARNFVDYLKSDHASAVMYKKNLQKPQ